MRNVDVSLSSVIRKPFMSHDKFLGDQLLKTVRMCGKELEMEFRTPSFTGPGWPDRSESLEILDRPGLGRRLALNPS